MGKHRRHHNATSGFSVYRDNNIDSITPYTGGSLDRVNPDFRLPANLPVPRPQLNRRVGGGIEEPFSYLFFEIDLNNNPIVDPDLEGWQIFSQENCVIKVPFQDGGVELANSQPGVGPSTNISSTILNEFYQEPDDAFDTSEDASFRQGIVNTGPDVGAEWTDANDIVDETDGDLAYISTSNTLLTGFNAVLSEAAIGMVADSDNVWSSGGQRNLSWTLVYAATANVPGDPTVTYETWNVTYDPVNQTVLSFGGQTTLPLDPSEVVDSAQAPQTYIDLTANGTQMPLSRRNEYEANFSSNTDLLYVVNTPPGYSGSFPNFAFVYVWTTSGFTINGSSLSTLGTAQVTATGSIPLTVVDIGGTVLDLFFIAVRNSNDSERDFFTQSLTIENLYFGDSIIEMTGKKRLWFQKLNEDPIFLDEYKIDEPVVIRHIPKENETIVRVYENNTDVSISTSIVASSITGVDSVSDIYLGDYQKLTEFSISSGIISSTTYNNPTAPPDNAWIKHQYVYANNSLNVVSDAGPFAPNQVEFIADTRTERDPTTTVEEYYEANFTTKQITAGDVLGFLPRQPTFTPGSVTSLNWTPAAGITAYGNTFGIGGFGDFGNVVEDVCYYIEVGNAALLPEGEFGLCDDELDGTLSSLSFALGAPLYPNVNVSWISKATKESQQDRIITLYNVQGTWDGVSFTEISSGTQRVALPFLNMASVDTGSFDPANYVLISVVYDPFD